MLKQTPYFGDRPLVQRVAIVCPVTLVLVGIMQTMQIYDLQLQLTRSQNWRKEFYKWLGKDRLGVFIANGSRGEIENFSRNKNFNVLIIGYEKVHSLLTCS